MWGRACSACSGARPARSRTFATRRRCKKSGITWTPQTLDTYIADPQKEVPGNRMPYAGMPDAADRADLIAYLQKATK